MRLALRPSACRLPKTPSRVSAGRKRAVLRLCVRVSVVCGDSVSLPPRHPERANHLCFCVFATCGPATRMHVQGVPISLTRHPGSDSPRPSVCPLELSRVTTPRTTRVCARQRTDVSFSAPCCLRLSTSCKLPKTPPERHAASRSRAPCSYARAVRALSRRLRCPRVSCGIMWARTDTCMQCTCA